MTPLHLLATYIVRRRLTRPNVSGKHMSSATFLIFLGREAGKFEMEFHGPNFLRWIPTGHVADGGTRPAFSPPKKHRENLARPTLWSPSFEGKISSKITFSTCHSATSALEKIMSLRLLSKLENREKSLNR